MLFCGAGFSLDCINSKDSNPLLAKELAKEICKLGSMDEDEDLRYVSDFFIEKKPDSIDILVNFLKSIYTLKDVPLAIENICKHNWRRIYTTNYDNAIELASTKVGKIRTPISLTDDPTIYSKENNICIHINGYIDHLNYSNINEDFKLTASSYVSSDEFEESGWYYCFKKDLENSNAIVFIGYSLYDIEIAKILFKGNYKTKTYFIVSNTESDKMIFSLGKYGAVYPIGLKTFSEHLGEFKEEDCCLCLNNENYVYFTQYEIKEKEIDIRDKDIENFIMYGKLSSSYFDDYCVGTPKKPYLISRRSFLEKSIQQIKDGNNIIFYSDFGNGKSVFLKYLSSVLSVDGNIVLYPNDKGEDYCHDIDIISHNKKHYIIVLDSYSKYIDMLRYIIQINPLNVQFILADRTNNHQHFFKSMVDWAKEFYAYNINIIDDENELIHLVHIIDNLAYWDDRVNWSEERKVEYLKNICNAQFSNILIKIFDSEQMKNKINDIIQPLFTNDLYKKNIFAICLLESMDLPLKESLISEVTQDNEIYNPKFTNNSSFKELFSVNQNGINIKSSVFSLSILKNYYASSYMIENLLEIAENFDKKKKNSREHMEIFKYVLRFSFVERILPETNKRAMLVHYYEELKIRVNWLIRDPHYWLQYGMTELTYNNIITAQRYFDAAYKLIKTRPEYDSSYIDTQQARLYFIKALGENDSSIIFDYFIKGHDLLIQRDNDDYKYRQVLRYKDIYDSKFKSLSKNRKIDFINACTKMINDIKNIESHKMNFHNSDYLRDKCIDVLNQIISET